jgi:hypothetical protein
MRVQSPSDTLLDRVAQWERAMGFNLMRWLIVSSRRSSFCGSETAPSMFKEQEAFPLLTRQKQRNVFAVAWRNWQRGGLLSSRLQVRALSLPPGWLVPHGRWVIFALGRLLSRFADFGRRYGVALPDDYAYVQRCTEFWEELRKKLNVHFFLVRPNGLVRVEPSEDEI